MLGGEITTQGELIDKAAAIGGQKPPRMKFPPVVLKAMIPVGRWVGPASPPPTTTCCGRQSNSSTEGCPRGADFCQPSCLMRI